MNLELQAKKNEAWGEIGYGIMWLFVVALIEGISYTKGFEGIFYHFVALPAGVTAIYKFVLGFRKSIEINESK
ncbi:MAG: hypothetical protein RIC80_19095 [Cyclobacteriaceae bacterium]